MPRVRPTVPQWRQTHVTVGQEGGSDPGSHNYPLETCAELEQLQA